jgi:hypothetical protein
MASEPPSKSGANEAEETAPLPTSAEDRKAAAALSKLDARGDDDAADSASKEVDADALGKAMKNLSVGGGDGEKGKAEAKEQANKVKVKVAAADVTLLVSVGKEDWMVGAEGANCWSRFKSWICRRRRLRSC